MRNHGIDQKLKAYTILAASLAVTPIEAQVAFTDLDPDEQLSVWGDDAFYIDFNDDGINDVTISQNLWDDMYCDSSTSGVWCSGFTYQDLSVTGFDFIDNVASSYLYGADGATPLVAGDSISFDSNWNESGFARLWMGNGDWDSYWTDWGDGGWVDWDYNYGQWYDADHKYLGVKFLIDGIAHFGWVQITTTPTDEIQQIFKINSYAYETTPGVPIIAGFIPSCFSPTPLGAAAITGTTAKVKWSAADSVDHYELQYKMSGAADWTTKIVAGAKTFRKLAGLVCDTEYEWRIRSVCTDGEVSFYSAIQTFSTASCRLQNENIMETENINVWSSGNRLYISIEEEVLEPLQLILVDPSGRSVFEAEVTDEHSEFELRFPDGIYFATLRNGAIIYSESIIIHQ